MNRYLPLSFLALVVASGCSSADSAPVGSTAAQVTLPIGYGIDRIEVTRDMYEDWLATQPDVSDQPSQCDWNTSFAPDAGCLWAFESSICAGPECGDHPQVCVDWCDARAYCEGVGKRLCGRIGGGPNAFEAYADPHASQWYAACSASGWKDDPFSADPRECNSIRRGLGTTTPAGSLEACQPGMDGYRGVMDLGGNVWEWEDSCDADQGDDDLCHVRGGAFNSVEETLACGDSHAYVRGVALPFVGFRCCSE